MKRFILLFLLFVISFSSKPENPWVKKLLKKPLHVDTTAMFSIKISQMVKFEEDSSTYTAFIFYSGKKFGGLKEIYVDIPAYKFSFYRIADSAFLFDKITKNYYQSNLKIDSLLRYFDASISLEVLDPIIFPTMYQPGLISTTAKDFISNTTNCIGLSYKNMPMGPLMSMGYDLKMTEAFAKPCTYYAVIDTITRCFSTLYLKMDTSKVMGNNPISINYHFEKIGTSTFSKDSIRQLIANYKQSYSLRVLTDYPDFSEYKKTNRNYVADTIKTATTTDKSQPFLTQLETLEGNTIKLTDFKGKYILLDFWFCNCPPCLRGVEKLNTIYEKFKDRNLLIIGVNPIDKNMNAIADVARKKDMKYMVCKAPKGYEKYFKVPSYPRYILISPDQKSNKTIELHTEKDMESFIKELDKKL